MARAAETRGGDNVVIARGETINGDLYVAANTVTVDGTVNGDLVAVANLITVNGTITGDLLTAGQGLVVNGTVRDDVRAAGQAIMLGSTARVGGDLAVGGLSLENQPGSIVQGDLLIGGYQALLSGEIGGRVLGGMDRAELRGTVGGDVDIAVSGDTGATPMQFSPAGTVPIPPVQPNLTLAEGARIAGKLTYRSAVAADIQDSGRVAGGVIFVPSATPAAQTRTPDVLWLDIVRRLASLLLVGLVLLWLAPAWTRRLVDTVEAQPLGSLGWGALALVVYILVCIGLLIASIFITAVFATLTLGGLAGMTISAGLLSIATLVLGYIGFSVYVAQGIIAYVAGRWLLRRVLPAWAEHPAAGLALGLVLYVILNAIPWVGGIVSLAVVLLALGALWQWGRSKLGRAHPTPAPVAGLQPA